MIKTQRLRPKHSPRPEWTFTCSDVIPTYPIDGVTSFWRLKDVKTHVNICETVGGLVESWKKLTEDFKSVFIVYCEFESKYISSSVWIVV